MQPGKKKKHKEKVYRAHTFRFFDMFQLFPKLIQLLSSTVSFFTKTFGTVSSLQSGPSTLIIAFRSIFFIVMHATEI